MPLPVRIRVPRIIGALLGQRGPADPVMGGRPVELPDVEARLRGLEERVAELPPTSPELPGYLNDLGNRLRDRYLWTQESADLDRAIQTYGRALDPPALPSTELRATLSSNLSVALLDRYLRAGELTDLEHAVDAARQAVELTPAGDPDLPLWLSNLSNALRERYRRTGNDSDATAAVDTAKQAAALAPADTFMAIASLINLGAAILERARGGATRADYDEAVAAFERAAGLLPASRPEYAVVLSNLGGALMARHQFDRAEPEDLDRAIGVLQEAVSRSAERSHGLSAALHALGMALWERYNQAGDAADLSAATRALELAATQGPEDVAELPMYLNSLAIVLSERFFLAPEPRAAEYGPTIEALERAWSNVEATFAKVPIAYKLGQQRDAGGLGIGERLVAANLQLAELGASPADEARRRALVVAEGTKSRVLTELVGRGDLPAPAGVDADLVARERKLLDELSATDTTELANYGKAAEADASVRLQRRRSMQEEIDQVWASIAGTGFEGADYVALRRGQAPKWEDLEGLAAELGSDVAVMSMFSTPARTVLLILRGPTRSPALAETYIDADGWTELLRRLDRETRIGRGVRGETWHAPVLPLFTSAAEYLEGVRRVVLAPQSRSLQVPWAVVAQRAGWRAPDGGALPLTTLPALAALSRLRGRPSAQDGPTVVAGNPLGDLLYAEEEAERVADLLGTTALLGPAATRRAVLERLAQAEVVHLATHAHFEQDSPLDSGIVLADGMLTARDILRRRLRARLLVLSACETGVGGALGGELAGLAQAFLQAGARSLVVSLWKVDDATTGPLMSTFHARRSAGDDTATALATAMDEARAASRADQSYTWGGFLQIGDWQVNGETHVAARP